MVKVSFGIGHAKHDSEGRSITIEYDTFYIVALYVPNSGMVWYCLDPKIILCIAKLLVCSSCTHACKGMKLERLDYRINEWDADLKAYIKTLEKTKPVIVTG